MKPYQSQDISRPENEANGYLSRAVPDGLTTVFEDEESTLDLRQLWTVIKHRMRLILGVTVGVVAAVAFWTINEEPRYRGEIEILVGAPSEEASSADDLFLGFYLQSVDYETQIRVLRSQKVLVPIAKAIAERYPDFRYQDFFADKALTIERDQETKILLVSYEGENPEQVQFVLDQLSKSYLRYSLEERQQEIIQGIKFVKDLLPKSRQRVEQFQQELQTFRETYNLLNPEEQSAALSAQLVELEKQYFDTQVQLKETSSRYQILAQQLNLAPQEAIASSYLSESPRYQNLLNQLQEVELELADKSAIFLDTSPTIQALQEQRQNLLPLLEEEAQTILGPQFQGLSQSPSLSSPSNLRLELNQQYVEAANELQILELRRTALAQATTQLNQQVQQMPALARRYTDLQQKLEVSTENLKRLLEAEQQLELDAAQRSLTWQVISTPTPEDFETPIYPQPVNMLALGTVSGLLLGLIAAFVAERFDPVFHGPDEVAESCNLPILGYIPQQKNLDSVEEIFRNGLPRLQLGDKTIDLTQNLNSVNEVSGYQSSPFLEAFLSLNTNIRLLGSENRTHTLVISSVAPSEGKSTVAVNLAKAAANMGQSVLLVDIDLRRPVLHERLGVENQTGLTNVLADGMPIEEIVQRVPHRENFFVLTAGDVAPDPPRLLSSGRMKQVMEQLQGCGTYDLIVYDTPPMLAFADARIVAPATDGVILVVKINQTERTGFRQTLEQAKISRVPLLGVAVNGITSRGRGEYYYRYYYGKDKKSAHKAQV